MTNDWDKPFGFIPTEPARWDSSWPGSASPAERRRVFGYLEERFGIKPAIFDDYVLLRRGDGWYLLKKNRWLETAGTLKVSKPGLRSFRSIGAYLKPTTRFIQMFGHEAVKGKMELSRAQLDDLLAGNDVPADPGGLPTGYLIITFGGHILGLGFYSNGRVRSQLPKRETAPLNSLLKAAPPQHC